ncbi:PEP-CTERM sorting domain-containing protein [Maioricimonas sp. JC845]|uniref:PEP-CTERM sorting domain-containing protein n=1 Tax=Maioricimonas sp. JC845 TaxID=3232138 RepID=UPI00345AAFAC
MIGATGGWCAPTSGYGTVGPRESPPRFAAEEAGENSVHGTSSPFPDVLQSLISQLGDSCNAVRDCPLLLVESRSKITTWGVRAASCPLVCALGVGRDTDDTILRGATRNSRNSQDVLSRSIGAPSAPEPSSLALLSIGIVGVAGAARRRRRRASSQQQTDD